MSAFPKRNRRGFTLIELLIVIAIIGALAAAVLVAVDPVKRIQDSRDSQRWSETRSILEAILKKQVDDRAAYLGEAATAQVSTATLSGGAGGDIWAVTINGTQVTANYVGGPAVDAGTLATNIDADLTVGPLVNANAVGAVITITSAIPGVAFTISDTSTNNGGLPVITIATPTPNAVGASIDNVAGSVQVLVEDATGVNCTIPASAPACPDASPALIAAVLPFDCVAEISGVAPEYLAEVPTDPLVGTTPTVGNLPIGTNNSGYYINRNASGRITIGACYGEQANDIKASR